MDIQSVIAELKGMNSRSNELRNQLRVYIMDQSVPFNIRAPLAVELEGHLGEEGYFTGNIPGHDHISLYDDLHWERHETKYLSDFSDWTLEDFYHPQDDVMDWDAIEKSDDPAAVVFCHMVNSGLGSATFDW